MRSAKAQWVVACTPSRSPRFGEHEGGSAHRRDEGALPMLTAQPVAISAEGGQRLAQAEQKTGNEYQIGVIERVEGDVHGHRTAQGVFHRQPIE